ncbi:hypothetical protein CO051_04760 [Candidatus Roizmanbacteria bacterium CG_4_9_14_0_2_um_filter_39_13]|uniref:GIY-YIG domain-containing protein n=2 Tax=Candidatus Roizmaniibacteriota TaxID=1752723 RepID=A0A2M8EXS0_9BACT|nr:MAG: hypothetical protein COY15_04990 [Candidatus Roizmanbacteria bacterium CG_4_10_14_0_2_um_filter_39_12]PJC30937.1 MAG: hypothetical protein CO051_04760 [Candidatus Roizmanbacteria bacterium CG_4_9_14_0_2_um_filter_39_13]PJE61979.1 MAG: hypothetical protein COU87_01725 [Candidatus Roizmanbacteria bacterium CG10_big_fil_rev_8_21_14_0_10_39_12]
MATLYILKSEKYNRYYIGSTNNLKRRLAEHNLGKTLSTKFIRPLKAVFIQDYEMIEEARSIERKLKKFKSRIILERIISEGCIKVKI